MMISLLLHLGVHQQGFEMQIQTFQVRPGSIRYFASSPSVHNKPRLSMHMPVSLYSFQKLEVLIS